MSLFNRSHCGIKRRATERMGLFSGIIMLFVFRWDLIHVYVYILVFIFYVFDIILVSIILHLQWLVVTEKKRWKLLSCGVGFRFQSSLSMSFCHICCWSCPPIFSAVCWISEVIIIYHHSPRFLFIHKPRYVPVL